MGALKLAGILVMACACGGGANGQGFGSLKGVVSLEGAGTPLSHAMVSVAGAGLQMDTDADGNYRFERVPVGTYSISAHMHSFTDAAKSVEIAAGQETTLDFSLRLSPIRQQVTVTASGREQSTLETFQSVTSIESLELSAKGGASLGEVLDQEPGVAKRSFGPGTSRPVIRGFDGDRVMVLRDGMPSGTLSSQSGDHGEPIDATSLDRLEVVKGPATLLYGSSAIGGVVNAITGHHQVHLHPHEGTRGYLTASGGSANSLGGGSGGVEFGREHYLFWADGGGSRTGDYHTPLGRMPNSGADLEHGSGGFAHYGGKINFNLGFGHETGEYGVPFASRFEEDGGDTPTTLRFRRYNLRMATSVINPFASMERIELALNYSDWNHNELKGAEVGTRFFNKQLFYRGLFEQRKRGRLSGSFGFSGLQRWYKALGDEVLSPPTDQRALAGFALEEIEWSRIHIQFGGRIERNAYTPSGLLARSFTGASAGAGINVPLGRESSAAVNYAHSYRAPALEELYNHGPHTGNLAYEVGNPNLRRERGDGFDFSLRHQSRRVHGELNFFYNRMDDFVYLAPTHRFHSGLLEFDYAQANSRYRGMEALLNTELHPNLWLDLGVDSVNAQLRESAVPLPRIPPLRGRVGLDARYKQFSVKPVLVLANSQHRIFPTETPTAGYAVMNLDASCTIARQHYVHVFSVALFNAADRLYRNHLSFIKELAPEIGRGVRVAYTIRFF